MLTESVGYTGQVTYLDEFYLAPPAVFVEAVQQLDDSLESALIVAHNPGLEMLVQALTEEWEPMPTAALAVIELPIDSWREFPPADGGRLVAVHRPKEIDFEA